MHVGKLRWHLRQFAARCSDNDVDTHDDRIVSEFLTQLFAEGYAPGTIGLFTDALNYDARLRNRKSAVGHESRSVMRGIMRKGRERGRGRTEGLTFEQYDKVLNHAREVRHNRETPEIAYERGRLDRVIVSLLFMAAMRRSEVRKLIWGDVYFTQDEVAYVAVKQSKSNLHGELEDIRVLSKRGAQALRDLRSDREDEPLSARVVPLTGVSINRHFQSAANQSNWRDNTLATPVVLDSPANYVHGEPRFRRLQLPEVEGLWIWSSTIPRKPNVARSRHIFKTHS